MTAKAYMQGWKYLVRIRQMLKIHGKKPGNVNSAGSGILVHVSLLGTTDILIYRNKLNLKRA
jgi:hypothetical protein